MRKLEDLFTKEEANLIREVYSVNFQFDVMAFSRINNSTDISRRFFEGLNYYQSAREFFNKELFNKRIIELGPGYLYGHGSILSALDFEKLGVSSYTGIDPLYNEYSEENCKRKAKSMGLKIPFLEVSSDGLSYLLTQPKESAIICSFAAFDSPAIENAGLPKYLEERYIDYLIREIYRITPENSISFHKNIFGLGDYLPLFESVGFRKEKLSPELFNLMDKDICTGFIVRKY